jgi:crossover junction endodeoxyribonuclease RuvC
MMPKKKQPKAINTVLSLDPATVDTGYAIVTRDLEIKAYGLIHIPASRPVSRRLLNIYQELVKIIETYQVEGVIIEDQFLGVNVSTIKALSWVRGIIMLLAEEKEKQIIIINNKTAKKKAKKGSASKTEVKAAVLKRFKLDYPDLDENISDAMAIGLAYYCQEEEAT